METAKIPVDEKTEEKEKARKNWWHRRKTGDWGNTAVEIKKKDVIFVPEGALDSTSGFQQSLHPRGREREKRYE